MAPLLGDSFDVSGLRRKAGGTAPTILALFLDEAYRLSAPPTSLSLVVMFHVVCRSVFSVPSPPTAVSHFRSPKLSAIRPQRGPVKINEEFIDM
jgi:hypothetical protein